ncbi:hypothetical protein KQI84_04045 [bacterium]|nr:hypothetical protein [bacterium]
MAVHFYIDLNCQAREDLGAEPLLGMLRDRTLAATVRQGYRDKFGDKMPESEMKFRRREVHEDGSEVENEFNVADVRERTSELDRLATICQGCPAAITGDPYSCIQSIPLPISEAGEEWLLSRIGPPDSLTGQFFRRAVEQMSYGDCDRLRDWRGAGFLKGKKPAERTDEGDERPLTSNQVLHPMLMVGDLGPSHCLSLLLFTRALTTDQGADTDEVLQIIEQVQLTQSAEEVPALRCNLQPEPADDPSVHAFKLFLNAAYRALSLEVSLAIRM